VLALPSKLTAKRLACPKCKTIVDPATAVEAPAVRAESKPGEPKPSEAARQNDKLDLELPAPIGAPAAQNAAPSSGSANRPASPANAKNGDVHVPIVCFVCGTRYYSLAKNIGGQAKCPDCFTMNEVRAPREKPKQTLGPGLMPSSDSGADIGLSAPTTTPAYRPMFRDTPKPETGVGPGESHSKREPADDGPLDLSLPDIPSQPLTPGPDLFRASDRDNNPAAPAPGSPAAPPSGPQPKRPIELVDPMVDAVARRRELDANKPARPKSPEQEEDDDDDFRLSEPVERTGFSEKLAKDIVDEAKRSPKPPSPPSVPTPRPPGPITFGVGPVPPPTPSATSSPAASSQGPSSPVPMKDAKRWRVEDPASPGAAAGDDPLDLESMAQALPSASRATATVDPPAPPIDNDPARESIPLRRGMTVADLAEKYEVEEPDDFDPYKYKFELPKSNWLLLQPKVMIRWFICGAMVAAFFAIFHFAMSSSPDDSPQDSVIRTIVGVISVLWALISFGYLANCCYFLAELSANDNKTVDEWPAVGPIDVGMNAFFIFAGIFWSGVATALLSVAIGVVTGSGLLSGLVAMMVWPSVFFLFPPVYVAMLESGSVSTPMTKNVLLAIRRRKRPWIAHYIATIVYFVAMFLAVLLFRFYGFSLTYLIAGIVVTGAWLLYFEQLGKLARVVNNTVLEIAAEEARKEAEE
jgi:phage FluMu protein Com